MKWSDGYKMRLPLGSELRAELVSVGFVAAIVLIGGRAHADIVNQTPIADAGSSRYAAEDAVVLDGMGSYDPDNSGSLTYAWRQIDGPPVIITDANTATPTIAGTTQSVTERGLEPKIGGFPQTDEIQDCEFELVVSDGELTSLPDTVKVIIVPTFSEGTMVLENDAFDPQKPTIIFFDGYGMLPKNTTGGGRWSNYSSSYSAWKQKANIISFYPYVADDESSDQATATYYRCADMIIVYLSDVAPDYKEYIQTMGHSLGGMPAISVARFLNETYADRRYAINRVTLFDTTPYLDYTHRIKNGLIDRVDGEQCWIENYVCTTGMGWGRNPFYDNIFNVAFDKFDVTRLGGLGGDAHFIAADWYGNSITRTDMNLFNNGLVAGAYWSVVGPSRNLQLASTPDAQTYKFKWYGSITSGYMDFFDESLYPGRLPEPVTLWGWRDSLDPKGVVFTCKESENAVGYELLFGPDPYRVMDYNIASDTPTPPHEVITSFPFEETWWTIRARDQHGSTIYADPMRIDLESLPWPTIENLTTGQTYGYIQAAIDHAAPGDEVVISPGTYHENIDFEGENLTVTSTNPNDPTVAATTIIDGVGQRPVVTFSGGRGAGCVLTGLTITGEAVGIFCSDASPTIRNCTIESAGPIAIEFLYGYEPIIIDCTILGSIMEVYDRHLVALWKLDETEGDIAYDSIGVNGGICHGSPLWQPAGGVLAGALEFDGIDDYIGTDFVLSPTDEEFSVFAWIKGGSPGQVIVSQERGVSWLMADTTDGALRTDLITPEVTGRDPKPAGPPLICSTVVTDGDWHRVGFVREGINRILYVDDIEVARDTAETLEFADGGLYIGAASTLTPGTFFSGLLDDIRIYNRAVKP